MDVGMFDTLEQVSAKAAEIVAAAARQAVSRRGVFSLALAGGSTPVRVYELLAGVEGLPWDKTLIFFGDERCLPPGHRDRNQTMAAKTLLGPVGVPVENVMVMASDPNRSPDQAAMDYEDAVRSRLGGNPPVLDLVLLGMGADGHTASLFPGHPQLSEKIRLVAAVNGRDGNPPVDRLTMTLPFINAARGVVFMVAGAEKLALVKAMAADSEQASGRLPAAMVRPKGRLVWLAAAKA